MHSYHRVVIGISGFVRKRLLGLLLSTYVLAAFLPAGGLWIRAVEFGELPLFGEASQVTLSMLLLAGLLFNAGSNIPLTQLRQLLRDPASLVAGLLANLAVPVVYIFAVSQVLATWLPPAPVQQIVLGLALIAAMPIAASSAAWAQHANGNLALSLGLILGSTALSPLTTPLVVHLVGRLTSGECASGLPALAGSGMSIFLTLFVLLPSILGIGTRQLVGEALTRRAKPTLKLLNTAILLVLNYTNASISLPGLVTQPDWSFVGIALVVALGMCVVAFAAGWMLATLLRTDADNRTALMFGLGLNNNGTGLVVAAAALPHLPGVMLSVILYTLVQHVVAGMVNHLNRQAAPVYLQAERIPLLGSYGSPANALESAR